MKELRTRKSVNRRRREQLGIVSLDYALNIAAEHDLDLVKIAPKANPPV